MFATFEKEYKTPFRQWTESRQKQAKLLYKISAQRYAEIALVNPKPKQIIENVRTAIRFARKHIEIRDFLLLELVQE